ncbi:MAG: nitroreductase family protein [Muribaculaceae bacterium]|nr:nitroreductase family protein [Muribaculaceae bacterium]
MLDVKTTLLERTSVRRYEREAIPEDKMEFIREAIRNCPNSYNAQQYSVIEIDDQELKEKLYELTGQKQIKTCNKFLVFLSDFNQIKALAEHKGLSWPAVTDTMDGVLLGTIDASLAMMSAVVAAQAVGLGTNCIGYLRTVDPAKVAELLKLPQDVFVVCGLAIGVPREHPDLKPKKPASVVFSRNEYQQDRAKMIKELEKYDAEVKEYNAHRSGGTTSNDWVEHILGYYSHVPEYRILQYLKDQGYNVQR